MAFDRVTGRHSARPFRSRWALTIVVILAACSLDSETEQTPRPDRAETGGDGAVHSPVPAPSVRDNPLSELGLTFIALPAGTFLMGAGGKDPDAEPAEVPQHEVELTRSFEIATTEVTVAQFRAFVEATGYVTEAERDPAGGWIIDLETNEPRQVAGVHWDDCGFPQDENHPVLQVSWIDAESFCAWLSERDGLEYRLPTEAEWEYACRAGTHTRYWFGDDPLDLLDAANVGDQSLASVIPNIPNLATWDDGVPFTAPVAEREQNPWGLYDMHGNAWEWCADWHHAEYYARSPRVDPRGPEQGRMRAIRGGGWYDGPGRQRSSQRAWFFPVFRYCQLSGFRVVRNAVDRANVE